MPSTALPGWNALYRLLFHVGFPMTDILVSSELNEIVAVTVRTEKNVSK